MTASENFSLLTKQNGVTARSKKISWCPPALESATDRLTNLTVEGILRQENPTPHPATTPGEKVHRTSRPNGKRVSSVRFPSFAPTAMTGKENKSEINWRQPAAASRGNFVSTGPVAGPIGTQLRLGPHPGQPGEGKESAAARRNFSRFHERNTDNHENFGKFMPDDLSDIFNPPIPTPDDEAFVPPAWLLEAIEEVAGLHT